MDEEMDNATLALVWFGWLVMFVWQQIMWLVWLAAMHEVWPAGVLG